MLRFARRHDTPSFDSRDSLETNHPIIHLEIRSKPTILSYISRFARNQPAYHTSRDSLETNQPIIHIHPPCAEAPSPAGYLAHKKPPPPLGPSQAYCRVLRAGVFL